MQRLTAACAERAYVPLVLTNLLFLFLGNQYMDGADASTLLRAALPRKCDRGNADVLALHVKTLGLLRLRTDGEMADFLSTAQTGC